MKDQDFVNLWDQGIFQSNTNQQHKNLVILSSLEINVYGGVTE